MITSEPRVDLPAVLGGEPVRRIFLSFSQPRLSDSEINAVVDTLRSGWLTTGGRAQAFENDFRTFVGTKHAIALNSCTAGLFLSLKVLDVGPGDEVITTPLTFASGVNVIEHLGARPIFADIDPETWCIDPSEVQKRVTRATKALIPVHLYGMPCDMSALASIAAGGGFRIVQDCAHAIEARRDGRSPATYGDLACYSFYATKNVTTGEGGMVATDRDDWADRLRVLALHGLDHSAYDRFSADGKALYDLEEPGYKFNMPDTAAALGVEGLRRVEERLKIRERFWSRYSSELGDLPGLTFQPEPPGGSRHSRHLFVCAVDPSKAGIDRNGMVEALRAENIGTGVHYTPVHEFTYYREKYGISQDDLPIASRIGDRVLSLPLTPFLSDEDIDDVVRAVRRIVLHYSRNGS